MEDDRRARRFFLLLLAIATLLVGFVARPLAGPLVLAAVLAGAIGPLQVRLTAKLGGRRPLAAAILVVGVVVVLLGPLVALGTFFITEGEKGLAFVSNLARGESVNRLLAHLPASVQTTARETLQRFSDIDQVAENFLRAKTSTAAATIWAAASATGTLLFQTTMMVIALYFLLAEGDQVVAWLDDALPLRRGQTRELFAQFRKVSFSVIVSAVITAAVQAVAALAGYLISRVPNPVFFAGLTFLFAFVPAVGAASVCLFAAAILYLLGHGSWSLFLALWGLFVVGLVDNVLKPFLAKAGMEMQMGVVFFALIGGLGAFGAIGLVIGPLAVAFFLALVRMYQRDFASVQSGSLDG